MRIAKTPVDFGFTRSDKRKLKKACKEAADKRLFQRAQAVLLVAQGRPLNEVAEIADVSLRTVYTWVNRYLEAHHTERLTDSQRTGRPLAALAITDARILQELRRNPLRLGYCATVWTVKLLAQHLTQRYRCEVRPRTLRRRMKALGLRCKRPRYFYEEKAPHRAQKKGQLSAA